jgi:membrane protein YdbS with pleckstrin-like domain
MQVDSESLLPDINLMTQVAAAFVFSAVGFGVLFGENGVKEPFLLLACVVWGLGFLVIFAMIYVIWLIFYAVRSYKVQAHKLRMNKFQLALEGKRVDT